MVQHSQTCSTYLVSARRHGLFVTLMHHVTTLRGQWERHDSGLALLRMLISRPIRLVIVALLSATNSTSVPPTSAHCGGPLWNTPRAVMDFSVIRGPNRVAVHSRAVADATLIPLYWQRGTGPYIRCWTSYVGKVFKSCVIMWLVSQTV